MQDLAEASGVGDTTRLRSRYLEELDELGIVELPEKGTRGDKPSCASPENGGGGWMSGARWGASSPRRVARLRSTGAGSGGLLLSPECRPGAASYGPREVG
jgi:hypothetical protein